jgi:hypothetical protein
VPVPVMEFVVVDDVAGGGAVDPLEVDMIADVIVGVRLPITKGGC